MFGGISFQMTTMLFRSANFREYVAVEFSLVQIRGFRNALKRENKPISWNFPCPSFSGGIWLVFRTDDVMHRHQFIHHLKVPVSSNFICYRCSDPPLLVDPLSKVLNKVRSFVAAARMISPNLRYYCPTQLARIKCYKIALFSTASFTSFSLRFFFF